MLNVLKILTMIAAAGICVMVLMQDGAVDNNLISAFSNKRLSLFNSSKERGSAKIMMIVTYAFMVAFMVLTVVLMIVNRKAG